jgi:Peptide chain release factor 1 (eRF1)
MELDHKEDYITKLYRMAEDSGAIVEIIGEESEEGKLLKKAFYGIAGLLRYAPQDLHFNLLNLSASTTRKSVPGFTTE